MSEESKALLDAAKSGFLDLVKELRTEEACDLNHGGSGRQFGKTALHLSILHSHIDVTEYLISLPEIDVNKAAKRGDTALHYAARNSTIDFLKVVLTHPKLVLTSKNQKGETAFDIATKEYLEHHVQLIEEATKDNSKFTKEYKQAPPAVKKSSQSSQDPDPTGDKEINDEDSKINDEDDKINDENDKVNDEKPKVEKVNDEKPKVEKVNDENDKIDDEEDGELDDLSKQKEFLEASASGNLGRVITLVNKGTNINVSGGGRMFGRTPLHIAALKGHAHIIKFLLSQDGIDVNQVNKSGNTAVHFAVKSGHVEALKLLLETPNVDLSIKNSSGQTAMDLAEHDELHPEILKMLKKAV